MGEHHSYDAHSHSPPTLAIVTHSHKITIFYFQNVYLNEDIYIPNKTIKQHKYIEKFDLLTVKQ